ncbi:hypothetical protein NE237_012681 [Protea cynaroides]|uniref:Uncharacterized protein n=1 Tax=Protea cynaroides TaxID=273540 RepID=A0A9Q0H090_9MAGN|nr:hypothetical protein NE237_012681 [Protea cynaroides]
MASTLQCSCFCICLSLFLALGVWVSQVKARALTDEVSMVDLHEQWMAQYGRVYKDALEKEKRFLTFKKNVEFIKSFNKAGDKPYKLSINLFADLEDEEFKATRTGYKSPIGQRPSSNTELRYNDVTNVPASMDWREKGAVTDIKNQGECGCCWAFTTVAAVEGITQLKTGQLVSLSEQELVDCVSTNSGCNGGWMDNAFQFIKQNQGLSTESNYPYEGMDGKPCNEEKAANREAMITGYEDVPSRNEQALLMAVANQPVSITIDGSGDPFRFYSSGIFTGDCETNPTHAVTLIGYGVNEEGIKYWLVKNSWGTDWGEDGYMKIQRDVDAKEGLCGLALYPSYPIA